MQTVRVFNATRNTLLGERIGVADTSWSRMAGLLGKTRLDSGAGLLIIPSQAVHTIAMRFAIDVVFVDKHWHVIHVQPALAPYRVSGLHWRASCVLELPVGVIAQTSTSVGDELRIEE
ncbi:MAG TPA: DUF192 domain-containing protein [Candidatus Eisenbacteria bacterium]|nr:DUF192 domain-containing protein [Candidatus Eisenbacteria bacterium]